MMLNIIKNPSFWILLGAFIGAIGAYIASEQQNIESKKNQDKLDSAKTEIINTQKQVNEYSEQLLNRNNRIIELQRELQAQTKVNADFTIKNSYQLNTEVLIAVNITFDVVKNNLESFEKIVLQSIPKEDLERAKLDEHISGLSVPIDVMVDSKNPFLYFTNMLVRIEFYDKELSGNQQIRSNSVYHIAEYIKSELPSGSNLFLFMKQDNLVLKSGNIFGPILLLSYKVKERKFVVSHLGSKKLSANITNTNSRSMYDLVGTNMIVQILPSLTRIEGVTDIVNNQLEKENYYEIEYLSIEFSSSHGVRFENFYKKATSWPTDKSQQHIHEVTYSDLKLKPLN